MKDTEEFVFSDGTVLPASIKCKNCKNHIYENWAFCPHCGQKNKEIKKVDRWKIGISHTV